MLKYSQLTPEQQQSVSNGCGGGKTALFIPNFVFYADCNQHDFYYWRGATSKLQLIKYKFKYVWFNYIVKGVNKVAWFGHNIYVKIKAKEKADRLFYYYMVKDLGMEDCWVKKVFYFIMATIYYIMVSVFGGFFFNWGERRTKNDLIKI